MKKIFKTLAIVAVAALGFACQNEIDEQVNGNEGEKVTVEVVGSVADLTRSVFGAIDTEKNKVPSTWSGNEKVGFSALASLDKTAENEGSVVAATNTPEAGANEALFSVEFDAIEEGNTVFAVSPYNTGSWALGGFSGITTKYQEFYVTIPATQTPLANSVEESTHLMVGEATYEGGAMTMTFEHVAAYAKMNITNFGGNGVKEIAVTFPTNVVGESLYYIYAGTNAGTITNLKSATVTINPENVSNVANGVWFTVAPVGTLEGAMTVVVTDNDDKTYTKNITLTAEKGISFVKGQVSEFTVNMSGIAADVVEVYNGLTNAEIASAMSKVTGSYQEVTIKSSCGDWMTNAYADKDTALQFRAKSGSYVLSPVFAKYIEKIDITFASDIVKDRFVYAVPATVVESLPSGDYTDSQYATNYGYVNTTVAGAQTLTLTFESPVQQFALLAKGGAVYVESIEVFLTDDFKVKEATTIELLGTYENTVDIKEGTEAASNKFIEPNAIVLDASDVAVEGAELELTYKSSDDKIATVAANGNVAFTGGTGSVTITISYAGDDNYKGSSTSYTITVVDSAAAGPVWKRATSVTAGKEYLLVCESKNMYLTSISTTSTKYGIGSSVTISSGTITSVVAESAILTAEAGSADGTYSFKMGSSYLYWSSGNSLATNASKSANSSWKVTISNGTFTIVNGKDNSRKLQWNASSPRFACYTTSQTAVQLYEKQ